MYILKSGKYVFADSLTGFVFGVITLTYQVRLLTVADYGNLVWLRTILLTLSSPLALAPVMSSVGTAAARNCGGNFRRAIKQKLIGGSIAGIILIIISFYYYLDSNLPSFFMFLTAGLFGPFLWNDLGKIYWTGKKQFGKIFLVSFITKIFSLIVLLASLSVKPSPINVFISLTGVACIINFSVIARIIFIEKPNYVIDDVQSGFGLFLTKLSFIKGVAQNIDNYLINFLFGNEALAIFDVGKKVLKYFANVPSVFLNTVYLPIVSSLNLQQTRKWVKNILYKQIVPVMTVVLVVLFFSIEGIYTTVFTVKYAESIYYAKWFIGMALLYSPVMLIGLVIQVNALRKESTYITIYHVCFSLIIVLSALQWGIYAIPVARLAYYLIFLVIQTYILNNLFKNNST